MVVALILFIGIIFLGLLFKEENQKIAYFIATGSVAFIVLIFTIIWPNLKYNAISYEYDEEKIIIKKGVIFRSEIIIPIIQVQDINTYQGPLMILFKLKGIFISTAGSNRALTGLNDEEATKIIYEIENSIYYRKKQNEEI